MLWVFANADRHLRCEVAHGNTPGSYRLIITGPDRGRTAEDITEPAQLVERMGAVMRELRDEGWLLP